jgi:uncharacterized protein YbjT (DUF2867 family)
MASTTHNILVTAPGGNIGAELIPTLLTNKSWKLILPTSNASRLKSNLTSTATESNVAVEEGSIQDPNWIETLLKKHEVETVFLCLTGTDELLTTLNFFSAMRRAGTVKYLLYLSACGDFATPAGVEKTMRVCDAEHVIVKTTIEQKLKYSGYPWETTMLGPTLFFSNDLRTKKHMLEQGLFDEPLGEKGVSRVSTKDIALVVYNLILTFPKYVGQKIQIGSLRTYTGAEAAKLWSEVLEKEVRMAKVGDEFEGDFTKKIGGNAAWGRDLRLMYEAFAAERFGMSEEEYRLQVEVLGKQPEDYEAWVKKVGEGWRRGHVESSGAVEAKRSVHDVVGRY